MGKIGDLFVRLGLKSEGFKEGMQDAKKETSSFGQSLDKMKAGALAVWAAIGASVVAFGKEMIKTTNAVGDAWGRTTAAMNAGWKTFVQSVSNFDFNGFIGRFKETTRAAVELQNALDAQFEGSNSAKIQRALMADELEQLRITMDNPAASYKERLAAAEEYMRKVRPIYEQEAQLAYDLLDAQQGMWLAGTKLKDNAQTRRELTQFLIDYGKDKQLQTKLARYLELAPTDWLHIANQWAHKPNSRPYKTAWANFQEEGQLYRWLKRYGADAGYTNFIGEFGKIYDKWRGDEDTKPLVDALINAGLAEASLNAQTREIQTKINDFRSKITEPLFKTTEDVKKWAESIGQEPVELDLNFDFDSNLDDELAGLEDELEAGTRELAQTLGDSLSAELNAQKQQIAEVIASAFTESFSGVTEALMDLAFGVEGADPGQITRALLEPLGQAAKSMGELYMSMGVAQLAMRAGLKQPEALIAAGAALIAVGTAVTSGLKALYQNPTGGTTASTAQGTGTSLEKIEQEITINVVGQISGDKIILAGQKTLNKWSR